MLFGNQNKSKKVVVSCAGFTLIEMVVVMGIIGIISGATLKLVKFSDIYKNLKLETAEVKGMLRTAQTLSLAPPIIKDDFNKELIICGFGIRSVTDGGGKVQIFYSYSKNNDPRECRIINNINGVCVGGNACAEYPYDNKIIGSSNDVVVTNGGGGEVKIFFRSPYGKVIGADSGYTIKIWQLGGSLYKTVVINQLGKINEQ